MAKIWTEAFWKPDPDAEGAGGAPHRTSESSYRLLLLPVAALAAVTVLVGVGAGPLFDLSLEAAEQLYDPEAYLQAVLGGTK